MQISIASGVAEKPDNVHTITRTRTIALFIFCCSFLIFALSPMHPIADSKYSMMVSQGLIEHRSLRLDNYAVPRLAPVVRDDYVQNGDIYQIEQIGPHLYHFYPPGTSILSIPSVLVANVFGVSAVNSDGTFNFAGEQRIESILAAFLMAGFSMLVFYACRSLLPLAPSLLITTAATLGTQIWSTTSRALFTDTWAVLLLMASLFLILRSKTQPAPAHPFAVATLMAWAYFSYPLYSVHLAALAVLFLLNGWRQFFVFCATGAVWFVGFVAYSWINFQQLLPNYFAANRLHFSGFLSRIYGLLLSPARGLLVFVPTILLIVYLLARFYKSLRYREIVLVACAAVLAHLFIVSGFAHWWGGHSFGPRLATACVPWFAVFAVLSVDAISRTDGRKREKRAVLAGSIALISISIFIHGRGATSQATWAWNALPLDVDRHPERLWDWRQPQFLAGITSPPRALYFPLLKDKQTIDFSNHQGDTFCWYGWSTAEPGGRWSDSTDATIVFSLEEIRPSLLELKISPYLGGDKITAQRVVVRLNGMAVADLHLNSGDARVYPIPLPTGALKQQNELAFEIPNATAPVTLNDGIDVRRLGIKLISAKFTFQ
ncbi:MAG TPA: hypothetical protein VJ023_16435 [Pyrinomonadaceae bacterium]|nr:hypothetical protein [Pyrinomonadaceae bacterium]